MRYNHAAAVAQRVALPPAVCMCLWRFASACMSAAIPCALCFRCLPASLVPMASPKQVFAELAERFKLEDVIRDRIIDAGVTSLSEFRYFAETDAELLQAFYAPVEQSLTNKALQKARLRQAWNAVTQAERTREDRGSHLTVSLDEEDVLPSNQLAAIRDLFWQRYRQGMPPEATPSDKWLTRCQRALTKRSLDVINVMDVRSVLNQRTAGSGRKRKVGDNLYYSDKADEDDFEIDSSWFSYLLQLRLYLLALAMVGASAVEPAPQGKETPDRSAEFVLVPLDVVMKYFYRVEKLVRELPDRTKLSHITNLDRAERAEWAQRFGATNLPLGQVILAIYKERDSHWLPPTMPALPHGPPPTPPPKKAKEDTERPTRVAGSAVEYAQALRDGTKLCQLFQTGRCPDQSKSACKNGRHRCAVLFRSGRVCGSPEHRGDRCRNAKRA